jgi:hypothetical protein
MGKTTVIDKIGQRYGRLLVTAKAPSRHGYARWWCLCDCGKTKNVSGTCLQQGRVKSCGCLRRETCQQRAAINSQNNILEFGECAFNLLYATYKNSAAINSRDFLLSKDEFKKLTSDKCFYCGVDPVSVSTPRGQLKNTGEYRYNGIDRVNNGVGYVLDNCVPCCKNCNWMKRVASADDFIAACYKIVEHQNHKKSAEMSDYTT